MLRHMIAHAPRFMRMFVQPIMSVVVPILTQPDVNPIVTVSLMTAVGDLAQVSPTMFCLHIMITVIINVCIML